MKQYPLYEVDYYDDFRTYIDSIGEKFSEKSALCGYEFDGTFISHTYKQLRDDVHAAAQALTDDGYAGCHIAIISENSYEYLVAFFAITYIGSTAVLIDPDQPVATIAELTGYADCKAAIASENTFDSLIPAQGGQSGLGIPVIVFTADDGKSAPYIEKGRKSLEQGVHTFSDAVINPEQNAAIVYTSGTTHTAKAVMLSHYALLHNACESVSYVKIPKKVFVSLPFFHAYGLSSAMLNNLVGGAQICINGDIKYMQRDMLRYDPETVLAVPLIAEQIYKLLMNGIEKYCSVRRILSPRKSLIGGVYKPIAAAVRKKKKHLPSLSLIICGGAHLSDNVARALTRFGILVIQGYGITECSPLICVNRNEQNIIGSVGFQLPCYDVRMDTDGTILVRGKCLMNGYYKNPELTAQTVVDGWFNTGDMGVFGKKGELIINGRSKNLIVLKNGKKVSPEELEALFEDIPMAKEVLAFGSAMGSEADDVIPAVSVYPDPALTENMSSYEILEKFQSEIDKLNKKLPSYKQIRVINIRDTAFERTNTGKIKRH